MLISLFSASLWITILSASTTAGWLWFKRKEEPALIALAAFCLSMAIWCFGHIAALEDYPKVARSLLLANPLLPTTFLHFVLLWLRGSIPIADKSYRLTPLMYLFAIAVTLLSIWGESGHIEAWNVFPSFFHIDSIGWLNLLYTITVGIIAHILLLYGYRNNQGNKRRSIIAMFAVGAWGFSLATSFILPSLEINFFPYPMLALPSYVVLVVYAVVRYRLVEVNRWVSQAIQWLAVLSISMLLMSLLLAFIAPVAMTELATVPTLQLFIYSSILLLLAWLLYGPAKQFSDRLIYPGASIDEVTLNQWLQQLNKATSWQTLALTIENIWRQHSPQTKTISHDELIGVRIINASGDIYFQSQATALFECIKRGEWDCRLSGWDDIPPTQQHTAELLAALIPNACTSLERSIQLAKIEACAERERIQQQHLIELGGLTAAIAHELRNPLNIINMASAHTDEKIKKHIRNQVARAEHMIRDTLSYAGQIEIKTTSQDLVPIAQQVIQQINNLFSVSILLRSEPQLIGQYDSERIQQILINLLENAASFIATRTEGKIELELSQTAHETWIKVHNNGPEVAADMLPHLFEPFVTQRSGGSGLGLSIVRRIVDAHHGDIHHSNQLGWPVSFVIRLPHLVNDLANKQDT
ncbi:MAG: signal transduction histidine kinase [Oleispira sp.]|jgi:signal transduction histidine kinase